MNGSASLNVVIGAVFGSCCLILLVWCIVAWNVTYAAQDAGVAQTAELDGRYRLLSESTDIQMGSVDEAGFEFDVQKGNLARETFFELFDSNDYGAGLADLDRADLLQRYRSAELTAFWAQSDKALKWLEKAFSERFDRGDLDEREIEFMYGLYLWNRDFDGARAFRERFGYQDASALPDIIRLDVSGHAESVPVWRVDTGRGALVLDAYTPEKELILMTMDVRCSASRQALDEIVGDEELRQKFEQYGMLLHGPSTVLDFDRIARWNEKFPNLEIVLVDSVEDWPENRGWSTPRFHFFREGELVSYVRGWKQGKLDSIRQAAEELLSDLN